MRITTLVGATAVTLAATLLAVTPAHADIYAESCREFIGPYTTNVHHVCVWAIYHNDAGPHGISVNQLGAYITGSGWENGNPPAVSGTSLTVRNDNDVLTWSKTGDAVTIVSPDDPIVFRPPGGIDMPATDSVTIRYNGFLRFNKEPDPGDKTIPLTITD